MITADLPFDDYLRINAVSAGVLNTLTERCPRAAWFDSYLNPAPVRETSDEMDIGTIAHSIVLEGHSDGVAIIDPNDYPAARGGAIPTGWTNQAIRTARDEARAAGKIPILKTRFGEIETIVGSVRAYIESLRDSEPAIWRLFQPEGGASELTMVWSDRIGPTCKIRHDRISAANDLVVDLKFTSISAEPDAWSRILVREGHYARAAFYRRGVKALTGVEPDYVFMVCETSPPYLCSLIGVDPAGYELGRSRVEYGLRLWRDCVERDSWPAYPNRVCYPDIPSWEFARWDARIGSSMVVNDWQGKVVDEALAILSGGRA